MRTPASLNSRSVAAVINRVTLLLLASVLLVGPALAEEPKIAIVDARVALTKSKDGVKAEKKLQKILELKRSELLPMQEKLKQKRLELAEKRFVWRPDVARDKEYEVLKLERDLERLGSETQDSIQMERHKLAKPILERVEAAVKEIGDKQGFAVIFEKNDPMVRYFDRALDITDQVIQFVNEKG